MEQIQYITYNDIRKSTRRIPFTEFEVQMLINLIESNQSKGLDSCLHCIMREIGYMEMINDGILVVSSPKQLERDFIFVKGDAGRGLFGGQKSVFHSYLGSVDDNEFATGSTFKSWGLAITGMINNNYRGEGFL